MTYACMHHILAFFSIFFQEVASVRTEEGDSRMTVLGHVKEKMIITPNFEALLKAKAAENT